jgi:hypothetical protein
MPFPLHFVLGSQSWVEHLELPPIVAQLSNFPSTPFFSFGLCLLVLLFALYFWWMGPRTWFLYTGFSSNLLYLKFYVDPASRSCWQSRKICQQLPNVMQDVLKTSYNFEGCISLQWESKYPLQSDSIKLGENLSLRKSSFCWNWYIYTLPTGSMFQTARTSTTQLKTKMLLKCKATVKRPLGI